MYCSVRIISSHFPSLHGPSRRRPAGVSLGCAGNQIAGQTMSDTTGHVINLVLTQTEIRTENGQSLMVRVTIVLL